MNLKLKHRSIFFQLLPTISFKPKLSKNLLNMAKSANQLPSKGYYCIGKSRSAKVAPAKVAPAKVAPAKVAPAKVASCSAKVGRQKSQVARQKSLSKSCKKS